jgi:hypothetical protein
MPIPTTIENANPIARLDRLEGSSSGMVPSAKSSTSLLMTAEKGGRK